MTHKENAQQYWTARSAIAEIDREQPADTTQRCRLEDRRRAATISLMGLAISASDKPGDMARAYFRGIGVHAICTAQIKA